MTLRHGSEILSSLKATRAPVIIAGAGVVGEALLTLCRAEGVAVAAYCDNSPKEAGRLQDGLQVHLTEEIASIHPDPVFLISVAAIQDAVERLEELGHSEWYAGGPLLEERFCAQEPSGTEISPAAYAVETCIHCHKAYLHPERLFLRSVDFMITERCSLRCRDCSNLMQYYARPEDLETNQLLRSMDALCEVFDEILEFRIIGGEAFMNRQWPVFVERAKGESIIRRIALYTNGTIVPPANVLSCLKHAKVLLNITNYGTLSRNLDRLMATLDEQGIRYLTVEATEWLDCASIVPHHRSPEENRTIFRQCCAKNMPTLSDGRLFRCPYAANAVRLSAIPDVPTDWVDLLPSRADPATLREQVRVYLKDLEQMAACDYCKSRPLAGNEVTAAIQAEKPLPYTTYRDKNKEPKQ